MRCSRRSPLRLGSLPVTLLALLVACRAAPPPAPTAAEEGPPTVSLVTHELPLEEAAALIGAQLGVPVEVAPQVDEVLTCSLEGVPWDEALDRVASLTGCVAEHLPDGSIRLDRPTRITLQASGSPRTSLELIAAWAGKEIDLPDDLPRQSMALPVIEDMHWRHAMLRILDAVGDYALLERQGRLIVAPRR